MLVWVRVVSHQRWGAEVRLVPPGPEVEAVIDLRFMTDPVTGDRTWHYPAVGSVIRAVVQGYMPNGQLRVSARASDLRAPWVLGNS